MFGPIHMSDYRQTFPVIIFIIRSFTAYTRVSATLLNGLMIRSGILGRLPSCHSQKKFVFGVR